eukprot:5874133-Karenia_brevis.AAC.1
MNNGFESIKSLLGAPGTSAKAAGAARSAAGAADGGGKIQLLRLSVDGDMHDHFCASLKIRKDNAKMSCLKPKNAIPFDEWWSKVYVTRRLQAWIDLMSKLDVEPDVLGEISSSDEVAMVLVQTLESEPQPQG